MTSIVAVSAYSPRKQIGTLSVTYPDPSDAAIRGR